MTEIITLPSALRRPMSQFSEHNDDGRTGKSACPPHRTNRLFVLFDDLGFDDVVLRRAVAAGAAARRAGGTAARLSAAGVCACLLVHHLGQLVRGLGEGL